MSAGRIVLIDPVVDKLDTARSGMLGLGGRDVVWLSSLLFVVPGEEGLDDVFSKN